MPEYMDQTGRRVSIPAHPQRIVSLVPSQTELLYDLGLDKEVAGITKFCIHPEAWFRTKTRAGGTKQLHLHRIAGLQPDLIIANKEENVKEQVDELAASFPVWTSDIRTLADALTMICEVGRITGRETSATDIAGRISNEFAALPRQPAPRKAAYLIWQEPFMCAGGDTFISSMLKAAGFCNVFAGKDRYPEVTAAEIAASGAEYLLLSSEPFPFTEKHREAMRSLFPGMQIVLVDGEMFSWYGSRLLQAPAYFRQLQKELAGG